MRREGTIVLAALFLVTACGSSDPQPVAQSADVVTTTSAPTSSNSAEDTESEPTTSSRKTSTKTSSKSKTSTTTSRRDSTSGSSGGTRTADCDDLRGSGTYNDPLQLGVVNSPITVKGCEPLTSGAPFNNRYFIFTLSTSPGSGGKAGARFTLTSAQKSAVHPRLIASNGFILKNAFAGTWIGTDPDYTGRYQRISDLTAGTYRLGMEKLDSPLRSITTPRFDVFVDPD